MKKYIAPLVLVVILVGGAFSGGMAFAKSKASVPGGFPGGMGNFSSGGPGKMSGGARSAGGFTGGEVLSVDDRSVTVKLPDGGSKIVFYSASTEITKSVTGAAADLFVGGQIISTGMTNTDGSVTAATIQIRPAAVTQTAVSQ